jgi:hypothetical protein
MANRSRRISDRHLAVFVGGLLLFMPGCGGSTKLEFYSNEPGNFRVLVAGMWTRDRILRSRPRSPSRPVEWLRP